MKLIEFTRTGVSSCNRWLFPLNNSPPEPWPVGNRPYIRSGNSKPSCWVHRWRI